MVDRQKSVRKLVGVPVLKMKESDFVSLFTCSSLYLAVDTKQESSSPRFAPSEKLQ